MLDPSVLLHGTPFDKTSPMLHEACLRNLGLNQIMKSILIFIINCDRLVMN